MLKINRLLSVFKVLSLLFFTISCSTENELKISNSDIDASFQITKNFENATYYSPSSTSGHHYVGNLEYVLGDVKQAQITNALTTNSHVNNMLDGFEEMGVNGIRIAIFADGVNPNETMYNYFYTEAKARGFKIFANPAQGHGGARIALGMLNGTVTSVKTTAHTNALIDRIKAFAQEYPCDWISPFNEDDKTGDTWYTGQMNNIYAGLHGQVNGADLVGPCTWGVPAGVDVLQKTTIKNYIAVATTHNLGFNHDSWSDFITEAGALPVWDSETNNNVKFTGVATRIDAAIDAGVNGLVLYNSWNTINKTTGVLSASGQTVKDKFTQYYFIQNRESGKRIKPYDNVNDNSSIIQVPTTWIGNFTQWELRPTSSGYVRFRNKGSKMYLEPETNNNYADIISNLSFSTTTLGTEWILSNASDGYSFVVNRESGKKLKSKNDNDIETHTNPADCNINQAPASWTGTRTQWELIPAN
ncbi:RICIN domain-containing protein [Wenyingzhuangia aestuarii]|uniref:RICIN domain-containing protein n=1 Tax=Wenyingzhuangia aestuarii TaxID=1647582 RepID=UPI001438CDA6|nr:RICIN domain-containing protein [Wenyingzhuangia aestuarii]NJB81885.1 hypothetical protein [Wenyingzhuangia aestuarii]